jgi:hypothetical protein
VESSLDGYLLHTTNFFLNERLDLCNLESDGVGLVNMVGGGARVVRLYLGGQKWISRLVGFVFR